MDPLGHLLTTPVLLLHVLASVFALALAPVNLVRRRRDRIHRRLGATWVITMFVSALTSFGIQEPFLAFSWLHALSLWTMLSLALGVVAIRRGNRAAHIGHMTGSYLGLWAAFLWAALAPDRTVARVLDQAPLTATVTGLLAVLAAVGTYSAFRAAPRPRPAVVAGSAHGRRRDLRRSDPPAHSGGGRGRRHP